MQIEDLKKQTAHYAIEHFIKNGMIIGLGTGSTTAYVIREIAERIKDGRLKNIIGIPTSKDSEDLAKKSNIPLGTLYTYPSIDVTIDGADEVDPNLDLIKGLGGALLREKLVAEASKQEIIVIDDRKRVKQLGEKAPLPVEVLSFAWSIQVPFLQKLGAEPVLRRQLNGDTFVTDNNNYILDCHFADGISNPAHLAETLKGKTGIVEHGLFLNLATTVVVAKQTGIEVLHGVQ